MKKTLYKIMSLALTIGLLASLIIAVVPAGAITQPAVILTANTISAPGDYVIMFDTLFGLTGATDTITVTFPLGTVVPATIAGADVKVSNDANTLAPTYTSAVTVVGNAIFNTVTITVPVAEGTVGPAHMGVQFLTTGGNPVINPGTPGNYTVSVVTSQELTPVTSLPYAVNPAGNIAKYNALGQFLGNVPNFAAMPLLSLQPGMTLKVSAGIYVENFTIDADSVTLTTVSGANDVNIMGTLTIGGVTGGSTVSKLNIMGGIIVNGTGVLANTVKNCTITRTSPLVGVQTLVTVNAAGLGALTLQDCTVDTTGGAAGADTGLDIAAAGVVTVNTVAFKVNQTAMWAPDIAIDNTGAGMLTVMGSSFTGTGGIGYNDIVGAAVVNIMTSTFTGLENAVLLNSGTARLTMQNCTVSGSITNMPLAPAGAIQLSNNAGIAAAPGVIIEGCTIQNNTGYSVNVVTNPLGVRVVSNNFSGNTSGFNSAAAAVCASLNYWGAASGPFNVFTNPAGAGDKVSAFVTYTPFLGVASANGRSFTATGGVDNITFQPALGVVLSGYQAAAGSLVNAISFGTTNPETIAPAFDAIAYFDVYTSAASLVNMQLRLYAAGLADNSQAYVWSPLANNWILCSSQGVAGTGDFVYVNINATSTPAFADLIGTTFVIVKGLPAVPPAFAIIGPLTGTATALTNVPFNWNGVAGANKYEIIISTKGDLTAPVVDQFTLGTGFNATVTFTAGTPYFWQVIAWQNDMIVGRSITGTFTPQAPPEPTQPPITITTQPPATITITQPPATTVTFTSIPPTTVTPAWIWGIIGIGAVLVIVVIVLIVRTRRTT